MSTEHAKTVVNDWQIPVGFISANDGSTCIAARSFSDGTAELKSTTDPTGTILPISAMELRAFRDACKDGQYDHF